MSEPWAASGAARAAVALVAMAAGIAAPPALAAPAAPPASTASAPAGHGCEAQVAAAARRYDIPLAVFYAVGLLETGGRNGLQPFSMNIEGRASLNTTLAEALATFEAAHRRGATLIDIGCMQVNYRWHGRNFASVTEMFDPAHNVDYAARFLRELKTREKTWTLAVARYNAGPNNNAAQKQYVCGVIRKMVNSGFGSWTANARAFCGEAVS
ncbi:MAG: transglycosylase SLT domain-containing protein [Janthinobacterium lividum]